MNHSPPILTCAVKHGTATLFFLLLLSPQILLPVGAQANTTPPDDPYRYAKFSPSMAIIIAVLIAALFLMGFFSIYIRHCSDAQDSASVRPGGTHTGRSRRGARGLDPAVVETFPTLEYSVVRRLKIGKDALECAVCLNEFEDDETLRLIPKCDHVFHPECIDAWLASHTTCPVCRSNLVPQPGDPAPQLTDFTPEQPDDVEAQNDAARDSAHVVEQQKEVLEQPELLKLNQTLNRNRTRGSRSSRVRRLFPRSHSTGHSLIHPGEDTERFTLRLPVEVRKQIINRELNRSTSMVVLPREGSSRRGPRTGGESGSGSGSYRVKNYRRLEKLDRQFKSDRWAFSMVPPFLTRMSSVRSPKVAVNEGEGTSVQPVEPVLSKSRSGSVRPPV